MKSLIKIWFEFHNNSIDRYVSVFKELNTFSFYQTHQSIKKYRIYDKKRAIVFYLFKTRSIIKLFKHKSWYYDCFKYKNSFQEYIDYEWLNNTCKACNHYSQTHRFYISRV